ncbi:hypothetical protein [Microcoleus sp.]|uniref:hypothetical protein n=1 Tax=Microcoleus sp. TaxID=44472 RepID=UPI00403EF5EB
MMRANRSPVQDILDLLQAYIAILNKVRYALCPMPYALCPMPYALDPRAPHVTEKGYS